MIEKLYRNHIYESFRTFMMNRGWGWVNSRPMPHGTLVVVDLEHALAFESHMLR